MKKIILGFLATICFISTSWADPLPEKIVMMGQELTLKDQKGNEQQGFIAEYIPQGETWDNWRLLFAIRFYPGKDIDVPSVVQGVMENIAQKRKEGDPVANGRILTNPQNTPFAVDFLISSLGTNLKEVFFEHNVFVYFKVPKGIVSYQLARRVYKNVDSEKAIENFILEIPKVGTQMVTEMATQPVKPPFKLD